METLIWIVGAIFYAATYEDFFKTFLESKKRKGYAVWIAWGLYALYQCTVMWYAHGYAMTVAFNLFSLFCVVQYLYGGKITSKILAIIVAIVLGSAAEVIVAFCALIITGTVDGTEQLYTIIAKILFWAFVRISILFIKGKVEEEHKKTYSRILIVVLTANFIIELLLYEVNREVKLQSVYYWSVLFSLFMLMLDIICFKIFTQLIDRQKIKRENDLFSKQLELCDAQMQERMAMMEDVRRTRHDMKNQIIYVQTLLNNGEVAKAQQFLRQFMDESLDNKGEIAKSGNLVVDSILNNKYIVAKSKNIRMSADLQIPSEIKYKASDLCIVLGNLMENAIEAAEKVEHNREIDIQMKMVHQKLYIKIKNTYNGECKTAKDGRLETTKEDAPNHGIGLTSVRKVIDSYDGMMDIQVEGNWFSAMICM